MNHMTVQLIWKKQKANEYNVELPKSQKQIKNEKCVGWNLKELSLYTQYYTLLYKFEAVKSGRPLLLCSRQSKSSKWNAQLSNNRLGMNLPLMQSIF